MEEVMAVVEVVEVVGEAAGARAFFDELLRLLLFHLHLGDVAAAVPVQRRGAGGGVSKVGLCACMRGARGPRRVPIRT